MEEFDLDTVLSSALSLQNNGKWIKEKDQQDSALFFGPSR